jgi:hypothetical protein
MAPHKERVVAEKTELDEKLTKLNSFFGGELFAKLDPEEQARLKNQAEYMRGYSEVLGDRIAHFA